MPPTPSEYLLFTCSLGYWGDLAEQPVGNTVEWPRVLQPSHGDLRGLELGLPLVGLQPGSAAASRSQTQPRAAQPTCHPATPEQPLLGFSSCAAGPDWAELPECVLPQVSGISTVNVEQRSSDSR